MKNILALFLLVGLFFVSLTELNASAAAAEGKTELRCAMPNFERAYKNAKAVFVGEVIGIETEDKKKVIEFRVKKFWKGIEDTKVKVLVYENFRYQSPYDKGETHLVFAKANDEGELWDGRCSRSRDLDGLSPSLKEDLKSLGEAKTCISLEGNKEEKTKGE